MGVGEKKVENMLGMRWRKKSGKHARNALAKKKWKTCQECVGEKKCKTCQEVVVQEKRKILAEKSSLKKKERKIGR